MLRIRGKYLPFFPKGWDSKILWKCERFEYSTQPNKGWLAPKFLSTDGVVYVVNAFRNTLKLYTCIVAFSFFTLHPSFQRAPSNHAPSHLLVNVFSASGTCINCLIWVAISKLTHIHIPKTWNFGFEHSKFKRKRNKMTHNNNTNNSFLGIGETGLIQTDNTNKWNFLTYTFHTFKIGSRVQKLTRNVKQGTSLIFSKNRCRSTLARHAAKPYRKESHPMLRRNSNIDWTLNIPLLCILTVVHIYGYVYNTNL